MSELNSLRIINDIFVASGLPTAATKLRQIAQWLCQSGNRHVEVQHF